MEQQHPRVRHLNTESQHRRWSPPPCVYRTARFASHINTGVFACVTDASSVCSGVVFVLVCLPHPRVRPHRLLTACSHCLSLGSAPSCSSSSGLPSCSSGPRAPPQNPSVSYFESPHYMGRLFRKFYNGCVFSAALGRPHAHTCAM